MKIRSETSQEHLWDVDSVYPSSELWEEDFKKIPALLAPLQELRGKLNAPDNLAKVFRAEDALSILVEKLHLYAHMKEDVDTTVGESQARMARTKAQYARIAGELAWISPEILSQSEETLRAWLNDPALKDYRRTMQVLIRQKPHTLSVQEETLLGLASDIFGSASDAFGKLSNADMKFPPARDANGEEHEVTNGTFSSLLQNKDRALRKNAFGSIYKSYSEHENTLASLLSASSKTHVYKATVRKHESALHASLFNDNIPVEVYHSLISAVHDALPIFHEYVDLRARRLKLHKEINVWDFYVPIIPNFEMEIGWEECRQWIEASTKPLGAAYCKGVAESFTSRWYDVYENKGKRSGAYSTGPYMQKPLVLLNYHGTLNDVFTGAHELGHTMHTYLSHRNQPYRYSDYPIFLAEIASTTNEALLHHHLVTTQDDPRLRAYLLNHLCDSFRGTLFRQAMFAEFELEVHARLERGEALTAESLKEYYYGLNAKFHGPAIEADKRISWEWSRIPHFYYNFYVYKYATGFAAAQIFAQQILSGNEGRDRYLGFLKSGSSRDPLDTVRSAGVDLADPKVLQRAFATFREAIRELDGLLDSIG